MKIDNGMLEDVKELHTALYNMYVNNACGCGNPECNRCVSDSDTGEVLHRIGEKYHQTDVWKQSKD